MEVAWSGSKNAVKMEDDDYSLLVEFSTCRERSREEADVWSQPERGKVGKRVFIADNLPAGCS